MDTWPVHKYVSDSFVRGFSIYLGVAAVEFVTTELGEAFNCFSSYLMINKINLQ